jgi:LemA protein
MSDPRRELQREGFSPEEVDWILNRASELQQKAETASYMDSESLKEGAESAGIKKEYVSEAIRMVREEMRREKALAAKKRTRKRILIIGAAALLVGLFLFAGARLNARMAEVEAAKAQLENVLQRRHDLIPNLINVAKAGAQHQQTLIEQVNRYLTNSRQSEDWQQKQTWESKLGEAMQQLVQSIGEGGNNELYTRLSDELAGTENRIAYARKKYNDAVANYNRTARGFPISLIRPLTGYPAELPYFQAAPNAQTPNSFN